MLPLVPAGRRAVQGAVAAPGPLPVEHREPLALVFVKSDEVPHADLGERQVSGVDLSTPQAAAAARLVSEVGKMANREGALLNQLPGAGVRDARRREHLLPQHDERQVLGRDGRWVPAAGHRQTIAKHCRKCNTDASARTGADVW